MILEHNYAPPIYINILPQNNFQISFEGARLDSACVKSRQVLTRELLSFSSHLSLVTFYLSLSKLSYNKVMSDNFWPSPVTKSSSKFFELMKWFILGIIILLIIHYFLITIFIVSGQSMEPNFHDKEVVLINRLNLYTNKFTRGEPMVLKFPGDPQHKKYIKRLLGMPGERVEVKDNGVFINGRRLVESYIPNSFTTNSYGQTLWQLGSDEYFLVGDNRENSSDSRIWGVAKRHDMVGPVKLILIPRFEFVAVPPY